MDVIEFDNQELTIEQIAAIIELCSNSCFFIIDCVHKKIIYATQNLESLFKIKPDRIKDMGFEFYATFFENFELIRKNIPYFNLIFKRENIIKFKSALIFNLNIKSSTRSTVQNKIRPIILTKDGRVLYAINILSLTSPQNNNTILIVKNSSQLLKFLPNNKKWINTNIPTLTKLEKDILILASQGYTVSSIANQLYKSIDTIKGYKRQLFKKFNVSNIVDSKTKCNVWSL